MKRDERRRHLERCAAEAFAGRGYHSTSVSDIIERAGIARGTFYLHFQGKRDIFASLVGSVTGAIRQALVTVDPASDVRRQLRGNVGRVFAILLERPELTRILLNEAVGLDKGFDEQLRAFYAYVAGLIRSSIVHGQRLGMIRPADPDLVSWSILGSVREVLYRRIVTGECTADSEAVVDLLLDTALHGIARTDGTAVLPRPPSDI